VPLQERFMGCVTAIRGGKESFDDLSVLNRESRHRCRRRLAKC
jgi:hypothetical protein